MTKIHFLDTTLRDGEQTPGVHFSAAHKIEIARQLAALGVSVIEAGMPSSSPDEAKAVAALAADFTESDVRVAALARAVMSDIDAAVESVRAAKYRRIHVFIATSPHHMQNKLRMTPDEVLTRIGECVRYACECCERAFGARDAIDRETPVWDVQFSAEDCTRSERGFVLRAYKTAADAGARVLNIPDTVGYSIPSEFGALVGCVKAALTEENRPAPVFSVHCHNDLGLASANSLAAVEAGATQIEGTVNGLGERAGNAAIEEVALALDVRRDKFGFEPVLNFGEIAHTSTMVAALSGIPVAPNKAIVGKNAFRHGAGIHQHGMMVDRTTYEIMEPEKIGLHQSGMVLGKLSGRHAFEEKVAELGYNLPERDMTAAFSRFKEIAARKDECGDDDVRAIVNEHLDTKSGRYKLIAHQITSGTTTRAMAMITLRDNRLITCEEDKAAGVGQHSEAALGEGPVDAAFNAVNRLFGVDDVILESFELKAVTEGADALGEAFVTIRSGGAAYTGRSVSADIIKASIKAYVSAMNKSIAD